MISWKCEVERCSWGKKKRHKEDSKIIISKKKASLLVVIWSNENWYNRHDQTITNGTSFLG